MNRFELAPLRGKIDQIKKGKSSAIIRIRNFFDQNELEKGLNKLKYGSFDKAISNGVEARLEKDISTIKNDICLGLEKIIMTLKKEFNIIIKTRIESFLFEYSKNHFVPTHIDKPRHKIIALTVFGDYKGGEYVYFDKIRNEEVSIRLREGDVLCTINLDTGHDNINLEHRVNKILFGTRYTIASSLIIE